MGSGKKKIEIKKIENLCQRRVTFTKRRKGLFKKAAALSVLTGCRVAALTFSSANTAFFHGDAKLFDHAAAAGALPNAGLEVIGNFTSYVNEEEAAGLGNYGEGCDDDKNHFFTKDVFEKLVAEVEGNDTDAANVGVVDNAGCSAEVGNCSTSPTEEAGLGKNGEGCDDKDLLFTEDELEDLLADHEGTDDTVSVDVGADNAGNDASSSDIMMEMVPWKKSNCRIDNPFQLVPCSSSAKPECYSADYYTSKNFKDMEMVQYGSRSHAGTTGQKASDELMGTSEEEELDQLVLKKQSMEAFMEDMREQYKLACEAGEMISELYSEDNPFIY